ncbi:MAG TPA: hypothetical protein VGO58_19650 [Chitinophagaceae bacterium]|jgi:hypothetical protein|nr:hypothetical protein [Chitinophagaceae bacterium]
MEPGEAKNYFGIIEIGKINNKFLEESGTKLLPLKENNVSFVHYPDCQQLIIWLPNPGREYEKLRLTDREKRKPVEEWPVSDKLSGSIQILWDTLPLAPGNYRIEIGHNKGGVHHIDLIKHKKGVPAKKIKPVKPALTTEAKEKAATVYRDGFGKEIVNEDLRIREKLVKELADKFGRNLEYSGNFCSGTIIYTDPSHRIEFNHEMGGGNCMFYIDIPNEENWEKQTGIALTSRKELLAYIATRVQREQASNCRYEIKSDTISYYYK